MKVKLLIDGVLNGSHVHAKGDVLDVDEARALHLVENGAGELVESLTHTLEGLEALRHKVSLIPK